eukprot:3671917-Rhodomonas_salina.1
MSRGDSRSEARAGARGRRRRGGGGGGRGGGRGEGEGERAECCESVSRGDGTACGAIVLRDATQCPVLAYCAIVLRDCYAVSGTEISYAAGCLLRCPVLPLRMVLCYGTSGTDMHGEIKYKKPQSQYNSHEKCVFLYLVSGCRRSWLCYALVMQWLVLASTLLYDATPLPYAILALCYAMSGSEIACAWPGNRWHRGQTWELYVEREND